ncbi:MAG: bifunctional phosphoribosylaminoimidazolecarboxamide formyltransferase/IMP cyclohydrolase [Melioribacteraceae bacterium]|nr:bifunctional phosphoribosylaminoimidazolecarboxamide formyltransferase/IMP cyclohydrolase [Melioribacteraceae bacterium]MCF8412460.1 bifunctional phosphoribosylaminoimidazolecarboxamide formyltransferase/IMP cyclohydrolase [Melioribacteraceae bacterium]MCF8431918.1 bifunctional phosphoribosylaminoimidazolecarboxamide formyltransferase/IMP cyclohydrolase [Melioribacteraceae bacterium]
MNKYALISVSDKTNIADFANRLNDCGYKILATGNTAKILIENKIECIEIADFTNSPEIFGGRVKTLHPKIFGGILYRRDNKSDLTEALENEIVTIDIVCVNLYPFPKVVHRRDINRQEKIENIDIGGPSLIRAAAKNHAYVSVLTNPDQYNSFLDELVAGEVSPTTKEKLATAAFAHTSFYDTLIADYFEKEFSVAKSHLRINSPLQNSLRYGENPHQTANLYGDFYKYFEIVHGKELSYNNIIDLVAGVELSEELGANSATIIKHTNPCGAAIGENIFSAYKKALSCDPVSAFGGIVCFQNEVEADLAVKLNELFLEIISAPSFTTEALEILKKKKNRRIVIQKEKLPDEYSKFKDIPGGVISQTNDNSNVDKIEFTCVSKIAIDNKQLEDIKFAWKVCKHTKSNAIVFVKDLKAIGVGAGQMSRVDSTILAASKARKFGHDISGGVAASDAFFPFPDGVEEIASHGIKAIVQPGGSVRDDEVIDAVDKLELAMLFTGIRNFKH